MSDKLTFDEAVIALGKFQVRGWRLGLDRMQEFLHRLHLENCLGKHGGPKYIHVAGTNGKGSVTAYLQSMLVEQGYSVGATYSPYVYDVRERVQFNRELISHEDFARLTECLLPIAAGLDHTEFDGPTEFEMKTALGFLYWAEKKVDWVALEVGLGGRLDATNVVDPACSVIVSIGMDHAQILGGTLRAIAIEKAGIIKPGRPVVIGKLHEEAKDAILETAEQSKSKVLEYGKDFYFDNGTVVTPTHTYNELIPGIRGYAQGHNAAIAIVALEIIGAIKKPEKINTGIESASLPGRFEILEYQQRRFILDGAHNPEAAKHFVNTLRESGFRGKYKLITGRVEGHESIPFFKALKQVIEKSYVVKIAFHRAVDPSLVVQDALPNASPYKNASEGLEACLLESVPGETILVAGSFYLVGEIGRLIRP